MESNRHDRYGAPGGAPAAQRRHRRGRLAGLWLSAGLAASLVVVGQTAEAVPPPGGVLPTAAVAVGDSFISGEGAGAYSDVADADGNPRGFEGWLGDNANPYYCHRSPNASIEVAELAGIDARFNISCSGGVTRDVAQASSTRERGRDVASQIDQLRAVAETHDIDLVVINLGANDVGFSSVAAHCIGQFITDAYVGWWEFYANLNWDLILGDFRWIVGGQAHNTTAGACGANDFPGAATFEAARSSLATSTQLIIDELARIDADGEHRIVLQDYVNPMPDDFHPEYHEQNNRSDTRDKFRALARERYAGGCALHRGTLPHADAMTRSLGSMIGDVHGDLLAANPSADIVYLDVQDAFDGDRLCENPGSADNALHTPIRARNQSGDLVTSFDGVTRGEIGHLFTDCMKWFQLCQESLHPNAAGHAVLGGCLESAWTAVHQLVDCNRFNGETNATELAPKVDLAVSGYAHGDLGPRGENRLHVSASYSAGLVDVPGADIASVRVTASASGAGTLETKTTTSGTYTYNAPCSAGVYIAIRAEVTLTDGSVLVGNDSFSASSSGCDQGSGGPDPIDDGSGGGRPPREDLPMR